MTKKITILTFVLIAAAVFNLQANSVKKYENALTKRNNNLVRTIADPKKSKLHLSKSARLKLATQFSQIELIDEWNLTSSQWDSAFRNVYKYNAKGDLVLTTLNDVHTGPGLQIEYFYNTDDQVYEAVIRTYDAATSTWVNSVHDLYIYDEKGRLVERLYQEWDPINSIWFNIEREGMAFNEQDYMSMYLLEQHDGTQWNGVEGLQLEYVFNSSNRSILDMAIYLDPSDQSWDTVDRMHHTYTPSGILTQNIYQIYINGVWENQMKQEFNLNASEVAVGTVMFEYNALTNDWDSTERMINMTWFNWTGNIGSSDAREYTLQLYEANTFVNNYQYVASRPDNFGSKIEESFEFENDEWIPQGRSSTIIDNRGNQTDFMYEMHINGGYVLVHHIKRAITYNGNMVVEMIDSELEPTSGVMENRTRFRFSDLISTGINNYALNSSEMKIYPNPVQSGNQITIDVTSSSNTTIEVFNLLGGKTAMICKDLSLEKGTHSFSVNVPKGIYVVHTTMNGKLYTNKLAVE